MYLNIKQDPVTIKSIEHAIVDKGWSEGWIKPEKPNKKSSKSVAVVGSGPKVGSHITVCAWVIEL